MNIDSLVNGIVIDHIEEKKGLEIYKALNLDELECSVAIITNARSKKIGKKDIIKIDKEIEVNTDVIGFIDPKATINIIKDGKIIEKYHAKLPRKIVNIAKCQNPRCITSIERELDQVFNLTDEENKVYRCKYCETSIK